VALLADLEVYVASLGILEWKRTSGQYVAILQSMDRFDKSTIKELSKQNGETVLAGVLLGTDITDWYAIAYDRNEYEFDEARLRARAALDRYRETNPFGY
jgi:hypothetical protein